VRAGGADPLVDKIAHKGSEWAPPPGRDAEKRGRAIWIEGLDSIAKPRDQQPKTDAKTQRSDNGEQEVTHVRFLQSVVVTPPAIGRRPPASS
jgi:hypothetical protein